MKPTSSSLWASELARAAFRPRSAVLCLLLSVLCPLAARAADTVSPAEIKRITERYALTHKRIDALLGQRTNPVALPANPPNPFYQSPKEAMPDLTAHPQDPAESGLVPEAADISDIDTLRKFAPGLRIGGVINRNGTLFIIVNNTPVKVGDIITLGTRDRPIYVKLAELTPTEFKLTLNDATLAVPIKK